MITAESGRRWPRNVVKFSYACMAAALVLVGWLHLGTGFVTTLFAYFALQTLHFNKRRGKWAPVLLFLILLAGAIYGLGFLINEFVRALPAIADKAIPSVIQWAKEHHIELPFSDYDSLKDTAMETVRNQTQFLGGFLKFARGATSQLAFLI